MEPLLSLKPVHAIKRRNSRAAPELLLGVSKMNERGAADTFFLYNTFVFCANEWKGVWSHVWCASPFSITHPRQNWYVCENWFTFFKTHSEEKQERESSPILGPSVSALTTTHNENRCAFALGRFWVTTWLNSIAGSDKRHFFFSQPVQTLRHIVFKYNRNRFFFFLYMSRNWGSVFFSRWILWFPGRAVRSARRVAVGLWVTKPRGCQTNRFMNQPND